MFIHTILVLASTMLAGPTTTPAAPTGWKADRHQQINDVVSKNAGNVDVVFVGDSITQAWENAGADAWRRHYGTRKAVNLGIGGDRTEHVLWRLENGNLKGITPKVAVVMIGTNNIGHGTHETGEVLAGVRRVVERIRESSPQTRVLLLDIFPRGTQFNASRGRITQINQALAKLNDGDTVVFLPIGHVFIEDDGSISPEIMPDALHLSAAGYDRWAAAIEPTLARMLSAAPPKLSSP
jgi:lysophospholipase L1-like esterase